MYFYRPKKNNGKMKWLCTCKITLSLTMTKNTALTIMVSNGVLHLMA